ncbi:hypothetical protein HMPREF0281_01123 [Corynebacterium ammoniagenes DSM 20306]|uniref:Uncharacterized protein n=1 Tax=Corynebacterium ammoniagenes DSM 20306 TaxID=649754 RepID=A0ABP2IKM9_CORAM|nr:hypothetical protein HMPREF0281_01123 [Corynebacterium ammoniagenes DSM 20306]
MCSFFVADMEEGSEGGHRQAKGSTSHIACGDVEPDLLRNKLVAT